MWEIKLKATNKQNKQKLVDTYNDIVVTRGKKGWGKEINGVKYMVIEGDLTLGGEHSMEYINDVLYNCTLKTYIILLNNVSPQYI